MDLILSNLDATGLAESASVVHASVERYLARKPGQKFDLVLLDPPYELGLPSHVLASLASGGLIDERSSIVFEGSARRRPFEVPDGYRMKSERRYGDSVLLWFELGGRS